MKEDLYEMIDYQLNIFGDETVEDLKYRRLIIEVLAQIPEEAREKALEEGIFIIAGNTTGASIPFYPFPCTDESELRKLVKEAESLEHFLKRRLIILNFALMEKAGYTEDEMKAVIAHEVAHLVLDHPAGAPVEEAEKKEREADDLAEKWGFQRTENIKKGE